jgi:hypothetical protein
MSVLSHLNELSKRMGKVFKVNGYKLWIHLTRSRQDENSKGYNKNDIFLWCEAKKFRDTDCEVSQISQSINTVEDVVKYEMVIREWLKMLKSEEIK